jgi:starvation-inducible DNA-binding protein
MTPEPAPTDRTPRTDEDRRVEVLRILGAVLADETRLAALTRTYCWNVVGPQFPTLHPFFQAQYARLNRLIDSLAERVRQVGGVVGPHSAVLGQARLAERPAGQPAARDMVLHLLADHETLLGHLHEDATTCGQTCHDRGTADFLARLLARHEKMARQLRALLEAPANEGI